MQVRRSCCEGKRYPTWHDDMDMRYPEIRASKLWEDLLPVFVHANIADKNALDTQSEMLVATSLSLLRTVRQQADAMLGAEGGDWDPVPPRVCV